MRRERVGGVLTSRVGVWLQRADNVRELILKGFRDFRTNFGPLLTPTRLELFENPRPYVYDPFLWERNRCGGRKWRGLSTPQTFTWK
jgi:hypothetical protein